MFYKSSDDDLTPPSSPTFIGSKGVLSEEKSEDINSKKGQTSQQSPSPLGINGAFMDKKGDGVVRPKSIADPSHIETPSFTDDLLGTGAILDPKIKKQSLQRRFSFNFKSNKEDEKQSSSLKRSLSLRLPKKNSDSGPEKKHEPGLLSKFLNLTGLNKDTSKQPLENKLLTNVKKGGKKTRRKSRKDFPPPISSLTQDTTEQPSSNEKDDKDKSPKSKRKLSFKK